MGTVEERLEVMKETVTNQLERSLRDEHLSRLALRDEQVVNKVLMGFLEDKFSPEFIERAVGVILVG